MEGAPESDASDVFLEIDFEKQDYGISELISFLKSAFREDDFLKAEKFLMSREETLLIEKAAIERNLRELELDFRKKLESIENDLTSQQNRCFELEDHKRRVEAEFGKNRREAEEHYILLQAKLEEMEFKKLAIEEELEEYKRMCRKLEERILCLEEDQKVAHGRCEEKIALKVDNMDLNGRKTSDIEEYKRRCTELEARVLQLEGENSILHSRLRENTKVESKFSLDMVGSEENRKESCKSGTSQKRANGERGSSDPLFSAHAKLDDPPLINIECFSFQNVDVENIADSSGHRDGHGSQVREQLSFIEDGSSGGKLAPATAKSMESLPQEEVVLISDSDDEIDVIPVSNINNRHVEATHVLCSNISREVSYNVSEKTSQMGLKRTHFDQRSERSASENASNCEESYIPSSAKKRKEYSSKVIASDVESEDDDDIPIGKLKMKKVTDGIKNPLDSLDSQFHVALTMSSISDILEESITRSRRLVPLQQCEKTKCEAKITSEGCSVEQNLFSETAGVIPCTTKTSNMIPEKTNNENAREDELDNDKWESEGESLGGFLVDCSDSFESEDGFTDTSEDEADSDPVLGQFLSRIRWNKRSSRWEYEADMLFSFSKDPELCMKALCALYRQQTSEEKSVQGSLYVDNRGFNKFDVLKSSKLADYLMDGDPYGPLKKSVAELEKHDPLAVEYCSKIAFDYSGQLFQIYKNKEDPYFP